MGQAAIFAVGCVIFFIVMTGSLLFGVAKVRETVTRDQ